MLSLQDLLVRSVVQPYGTRRNHQGRTQRFARNRLNNAKAVADLLLSVSLFWLFALLDSWFLLLFVQSWVRVWRWTARKDMGDRVAAGRSANARDRWSTSRRASSPTGFSESAPNFMRIFDAKFSCLSSCLLYPSLSPSGCQIFFLSLSFFPHSFFVHQK